MGLGLNLWIVREVGDDNGQDDDDGDEGPKRQQPDEDELKADLLVPPSPGCAGCVVVFAALPTSLIFMLVATLLERA